MDAFSGLEGALVALFWLLVIAIPTIAIGIGIGIGWWIWG